MLRFECLSRLDFRLEQTQFRDAALLDFFNAKRRPLPKAIEKFIQRNLKCKSDLQQRLQIQTAARLILSPLRVVVARRDHDVPHVEVLGLTDRSDPSAQRLEKRSELSVF